MSKKNPNLLELVAGELLFSKGDPGGDLYCIERGQVEIFVCKDGRDVVYTEMGEGEIIGVMTCLTSEPRLASARAKSEVVCRLVPHSQIQQALERMPRWFQVVIKEYTNRLEEMNRRYSEAVLAGEQLRDNQISHLYTARQLAAILSALLKFKSQRAGERGPTLLDPLLEQAAAMITQPRSVVDQLCKVFTDSGLLRLEDDAESRKPVLPADQLGNLLAFSDFVENIRSPASRRLLKQNLRGRDAKTLVALARLAVSWGGEPDKLQRLPLAAVRDDLAKQPSLRLDEELVRKAVAAGILALEEGEGQPLLLFAPVSLGRTAAALAAWLRLGVLDRSSEYRLGRSGGEQGAAAKKVTWHYE